MAFRSARRYPAPTMKHRACPLCGKDRPEPLATIRAAAICAGNSTYASDALDLLRVSPTDAYSFVRCSACGFLYAQHAPDGEFLKHLYERVISVPLARMESQRPRWVAHQLGLAQKLLERLGDRDEVRILDYGCGYGSIVRALQSPAISCVGYEYSEAVAGAGRAAGLDIVTDRNALAERGPFDGIILSDVLEHLEEPLATLAECAALLRPGGWLCVSVPDFSDARAAMIIDQLRRGLEVTRELNPWEHLNYFSPSTLSAMLTRAGYRVDPHATATFGLRAEAGGIARWGNAVKTLGRMLSFVGSPRATSTTLLAQKE